MAGDPDKSNSFWQELKRRKVIRVIIGYAAAAYVILELTSIIAEPLGLPSWTINFILILLIAGFIITAIISWIYDFTPEGIRKTGSAESGSQKSLSKDTKPARKKLKVSDIIIAVLIIIVIVLVYPKIFRKDKFRNIKNEDGRISIAVMPFENHTGDTTLNWFSNGISSLIINVLGSSPELAVCDDHTMYEVTESSNQVYTAGISPARAQGIAKLARAETYITGSYQGRQDTYWILANLVNTETGNVISTHRVEGNLQSSAYLEMAGSLCEEIKTHLEIKAIEENAGEDVIKAYTRSAEAYRHYIEGLNMIMAGNYDPAIEEMRIALETDSTFALASFFIAYSNSFKRPQDYAASIEWTRTSYNMRENLPFKYRNWLEMWYTCYWENNLDKLENKLEIMEKSEIESTLFWFDIGITYTSFLHQYDKAIFAFEKVLQLRQDRGEYPRDYSFYRDFAKALHVEGFHEREKEILEMGLDLLKDDISKREMYYRLALCALSRNDTTAADGYLEEYINAKHRLGNSEHNIQISLALFYYDAGMSEEAEVHTRKAIELNPGNDNYKMRLAGLLIEQDIDIDEGLQIIDKEFLTKYPGSANGKWIKAIACYKLGSYQEAYDLLNEANEIFVQSGHANNFDRYQLQKKIEQALAGQEEK